MGKEEVATEGDTHHAAKFVVNLGIEIKIAEKDLIGISMDGKILRQNSQSFDPQAYNLTLPPMTTPSDNTIWYPDSGATRHVTNDPQALVDLALYQGTEQLQIGNGSGLSIHSIGSSSISSQSHPPKLQNILHVPEIKKNLLPIYRLTNDNYVYVEFHADHCIIKEEDTERPLLRGIVRERLYLISQSKSICCREGGDGAMTSTTRSSTF